jgi:branched-chain amino acid transport system substrate-binding protein
MRRLSELVVGAILLLSGLGAPAAAAEVVKVGMIASYTGAFATWGTQFQQAIEAYQALHGDTVNGPDGKPIQIQFVYRDTASQGPDKAKQLAQELILHDHAKFLCGLELSPYAMALADISKEAKVPVVIMNAATASITRMSPYFVRVSATVPQDVAPLGTWAAAHGVKRIYTIVSDYAPGYDAEKYFTKTFKAAGGQIVGSARTPQQETNFSAYMERVLEAKPDALYMFQPAGSPSVAFVKAYVERGLKGAGIKLLGGGETQELYLANFTDDIVGTITSMHYTENNTNPANLQLKANLKKMFGEKAIPDIASVAAWDGTMLIQEAVAALGADADGLKYVDFMRGKKFQSPRGPVEIDPVERDIIQNIYIRRVEKVGGKLSNVNIGEVDMVKDPWKLDNPPKSN